MADSHRAEEQTDEDDFIDQREDPRAPIRIIVDMHSVTQIQTVSDNVSRGGIFVMAKKELPVGSLVELKFEFPDVSEPIEAMGRIKWHRTNEQSSLPDSPPGYGVEFIGLDPEDEQRIVEFVDKKLPDDDGG